CRVKVVKNKVAPPYRQALFDMIHGYGISHTGCLLDMGVEHGFVEKSGSWFLCGETRLGQGRENAKAFLQDNPKLAADIEKQLREKVLMKPADKKAQDAKKDAPETMPVAKKDEAPVKPAAKKKAAVK
ncbi:MAG: DNA recombination/repair protein RecA, partial [Elusimicrobia bacterium]